MIRSLTLILVVALLAAGAGAERTLPAGDLTQVVATLESPPLAYASWDVRAATQRLEREQSSFLVRLRRAGIEATVHWRYRLVANGFSLSVSERAVPLLRTLPGVAEVYENVRYGVSASPGVTRMGAPQLWGSGLESAGQGMKIGIIDDGVDHTSPYFAPSGYTMPEGFPKGQSAYTTAKVIVARAFPPPRAAYPAATLPFDPEMSSHGTHVAGIAAGNANTPARGQQISGAAPRAYIGNYKALTIPTDADVGLDGNAPELVAAVEAAVADGMDVINLSLGQPEIEPTRDILALALDAAAAAGVVPVVAAGNDFESFGRGSVISPGSSTGAITVAAASIGQGEQPDAMASFSSAGPTDVSLRLKPDVTAPGVSVLSSMPGGFGFLSGTSMAAPHVAGAAALLRQRHPSWTVAQLKAALVGTARPVRIGSGAQEAPPTRSGGGAVDLVAADRPLVFASPSSVSLGLLRGGAVASAEIEVVDAGGGAGSWEVAVDRRQGPAGATVTVSAPVVSVPGRVVLTATLDGAAVDGEASGYVTLRRGGVQRRVPFWFRVTVPRLLGATATPLTRPGVYAGNTRGQPALVSTYRYPDVPESGPVTARLEGPEQLFRFRLDRAVANFGVVVTRRAPGVTVEPRVIVAGDENRLVGHTALPLNLNPYLVQFYEPVLAAGAVRPAPGTFDVVFDSATTAGAGSYSFRFWVDDVSPPTATLLTKTVRRGIAVRVRLADAGSGVDPATIDARIDGTRRNTRHGGGVLRVLTGGLKPGKHRLRVQVSDYQESRNMENVGPILPNTRVLAATITVR